MNQLINQVLTAVGSKNYDYIAFDFFDTIVSRTVHPAYVKKMWAKEIVNFLSIDQSPDEIFSLRKQVEDKIKNYNTEQGFDGEINYEEFIHRMSVSLREYCTFDIEYIAAAVKRMDLETEYRLQVINQDVLQIIRHFSHQGKKLICISDFYLPAEMLKQCMVKHNILQYFHKVFVSQDVLLKKASGRIYHHVTETLNIEENRLFMIGDNIQSDYRIPKRLGIDAFWIDRSYTYSKYQNKKDQLENPKEYIKQNCMTDFKAPFANLAYTLYLYIDRLYAVLLKKRVSNIFFLSREGMFLKMLFEEYRDQQGYQGRQYIRTHYLLASRRSTYVCTLKKFSKEVMDCFRDSYPNLTIESFFKILSIDDRNIDFLCSALDVSRSDRLDHSRELASKLKNSQAFIRHYNTVTENQADMFQKYVDQFDVDIYNEGIHVADIGWQGSIQKNISKIYQNSVPVTGYYLGAPNQPHTCGNGDMLGLLFRFDYISKQRAWGSSRNVFVYGYNLLLYEMLLMASHGSPKYYRYDIEGISPVLEENREEETLYLDLIEPVQINIYRAFMEILACLKKTAIRDSDYEKNFFQKHHNLVLHLTTEEIAILEKVSLFYKFL